MKFIINILKRIRREILNFLFKSKFLRIYFFYIFSNKFTEYKIFSDLNEKDIFIDFGSHLGFVSQYVHDKFNCKIYAFEANPACFKVLRERFKNNKNIKVFNYAVSNKDGHSNFYLTKRNKINENSILHAGGGSLDITKNNINRNNKITVKTKNVKKILSKFKKISILKMDIEGWEYIVLPEILKNINKINKIVCEFHLKSKTQKKKYKNIQKRIRLNKKLNRKIFAWI